MVPERKAASSGDSLTSQVYDALKADIIMARIPPGDILVEPYLAERFGVSKTPVREALTLLRNEGLVGVMPRKGYFVTPIELGAVQEVYYLRRLLEPAAAELAAYNATEEELRLMEETLSLDDSRGNLDPMIQQHHRFHALISAASRNRLMDQFISNLLEKVLRLLYYRPGHGWPFPKHLDEHRSILNLLAAKDGRAARAAMEAHLESVRNSIRELF